MGESSTLMTRIEMETSADPPHHSRGRHQMRNCGRQHTILARRCCHSRCCHYCCCCCCNFGRRRRSAATAAAAAVAANVAVTAAAIDAAIPVRTTLRPRSSSAQTGAAVATAWQSNGAGRTVTRPAVTAIAIAAVGGLSVTYHGRLSAVRAGCIRNSNHACMHTSQLP